MTSFLPHGRLRLRAVLALLCLMALLPSVLSTAPATAQDEDRLDEIDSEIDEAEGQIDAVEGEIDISLAELDRILAEQQQLQGELDRLNDELAGAQAELEDSERILQATTVELTRTEVRLVETRGELDAQQTTVENRLREAYMSGAQNDTVLPLFSSDDVAAYSQAATYLEALVRDDRAGYEQIDVLRRLVEADEAELERLQEQQDADRVAAAEQRDGVADLVAQQEVVVAEVAARAEDKQVVLAGLESDRDAAENLVASLQAESDRIEAELAAAAAAEAAALAAAQSAASSASTSSSGSSSAGSSSGTAGVVAGSGRFILPVGGRISSEFGYRIHPISGVSRLHAGMDIAAGSGTPIGAAGAGTVQSVGWQGGYGNTVVISHGGGIATLYAHQSRTGVSVGQSVSQGQVIGYVGSTGYSTGPHLHWEVRINGGAVNPRGYL